MPPRTIAHLSDLHIGLSPRQASVSAALRRAIDAAKIDHVIVTGDVTQHGRIKELEAFDEIFGSLRRDGRLTVVPGNHDRLGDDIGRTMMNGPRADLVRGDGLSIIRINTTQWYNRIVFAEHGHITRAVIAETDRLLDQVPAGDLTVIALHHHLLPLPEEEILEHLASWFRLPFAAELSLGRVYLEHVRGRCDLVLHGHRHAYSETIMPDPSGGELRIFNAGSSTALGSFRAFTHQDGKLIGPPAWIRTE